MCKKSPTLEDRRRAGSALGLGGKKQRAELLKLGLQEIVPRSRDNSGGDEIIFECGRENTKKPRAGRAGAGQQHARAGGQEWAR